MMNGPSLDWNKMQGAFGLIMSNDHLIWRLAIVNSGMEPGQ